LEADERSRNTAEKKEALMRTKMNQLKQKISVLDQTLDILLEIFERLIYQLDLEIRFATEKQVRLLQQSLTPSPISKFFVV